MSSKVSIDNLDSVVMKELNEYLGLSTEAMENAVDKTAKETVNQIKATAPIGKRKKYYKSWKTKTTEQTANKKTVTVYSPTQYRLAHLLENGHAKRGGGRVSGKPHLAPAEEMAIKMVEEEIKRALKQ